MKLNSLIVSVDLRGCPNRCRHCWLGHAPNPHLSLEDLRAVAAAFRPLAREFEIEGWYREPDYMDDYRALWAEEAALSTRKTPHFELCSFYRLVRDDGYAPWLYAQGVREMQLTFFGGEGLTDHYVGRAGAYRELVQSLDILLKNGIAPRIQVFVNQQTLPELPQIEALIAEKRLDARCAEVGRAFHFFLHTGSCDGANAQQYACWLTAEDIPAIPPALLERTLAYFGASSPADVFGKPENAWIESLQSDRSTVDLWRDQVNFVDGAPVIFVDGNFDAYPNYTAPGPNWRLGNVFADGAEAVLRAYQQNASRGQRALSTVPACELARLGDPASHRLFGRGDYVAWLVRKYLERE